MEIAANAKRRLHFGRAAATKNAACATHFGSVAKKCMNAEHECQLNYIVPSGNYTNIMVAVSCFPSVIPFRWLSDGSISMCHLQRAAVQIVPFSTVYGSSTCISNNNRKRLLENTHFLYGFQVAMCVECERARGIEDGAGLHTWINACTTLHPNVSN